MTVVFTGPVAAADVDASQMAIDIDNGQNPTVQVDAVSVTFVCGTSGAGNTWTTSSSFVAGVAPDTGTVM